MRKGTLDRLLEFMPLFIAGIITIIVIAFILNYVAEKRRREFWMSFASAHGLVFSPDKLSNLEERFPHFELFRRGSNQYGKNFLTGPWHGLSLTLFDYHYQVTSGSGDSRRTRHYHFTVILLKPDFPLKSLAIRPQGFLDKIAAVFGWEDIGFESAEFSKRYHISASERRWAYDVITPRNMELLLAQDECTLEMDSQHLLLPLTGLSERESILSGLALGTEFLEKIPNYARTPTNLQTN
jgi:hypothetical protein